MNMYGFPHEEKQQRAEAWVAAWHTMQASTDRVERVRAEQALTALYCERGLHAPDFVWVDDPTDAIMAWHVISQEHEPLRNPSTKGDWGSGTNRDLYQLQDPFGLDPVWSGRALRRARELSPLGFDPVAGYAADGARLRSQLDGRVVDTSRRYVSRNGPGDALEVTARTEMLSRIIVGDAWKPLTSLVGSRRVVQVAISAAQRSATELLDPSWSRRTAMWALTFAAYDRTTIAVGALPHVLGVALWRQLDQRAGRTNMVERRLELARTGVAFMAFKGVAIMLDRPTEVGFDDAGRLHGERGPALRFPDGTAIWADHGVEVPSDIITDPDSITVERIDAETNAEVRRVMTERFGPERLVREGGAELVDEDEVGRLWRRGFPGPAWRAPEPIVMVEVRNSTPEPDGSVRTYFLRVPPTMRSARAAVAWTFGLHGSAYEPAVET